MPRKTALLRPAPLTRAMVIAAVATLTLLSACQRAEEKIAPEIRPVRMLTISKGVAGDTITLSGTVQAQTETNKSFRIDGRLLDRNVNIGDTVRPGQLIARLDAQNEESSLQSARAQLAAAQARLTEAQNMYGRMRELVTERAVSRAQFEQSEAMRKTAEAQVESAQSAVTIAENRLSYTNLVADTGGVVTSVGAEPGEVVGAGRMIVQVAREGGRDAVFDMPARVKDSAAMGAELTMTLVSDPKVTATGNVREISPRADPVTGTFRVRVRLNNPPATMRLGSTVTGRIKLAATTSIEIPPSAVVRAEGKAAVWVVDPKAGTVASRTIQIRSSDPNRVDVASGLEPGDVVVVAGVQALRPGQKVRPLETRQ